MRHLNVTPLDILKITEGQWHDLLAARTEYSLESRPGEPAPTQQEQRLFISQIPDLRDHVEVWLFHDDDANCVGWCTLAHPKPESPDYEANKDRVYIEPVVLARYRRQGIGTQLLSSIVNYAQKVGVNWIQWDTKFESGFRFSEKIGAVEAGQEIVNRLAVEQVDWEMMAQWVAEGQARNPEVELVRFANLPEPGLIGPLCSLITEINLMQPRDKVEGISYTMTAEEFAKSTLRLKERRIDRIIFCLREPDHTLSGMTDLYYSRSKLDYASVRLTGVRREFQNRGRAKWLKAALMLELRARYPEVKFVDTENFNQNSPILSINDRMGFRLFEQNVFYKIRVQDLAAKVGIPPGGLPGAV